MAVTRRRQAAAAAAAAAAASQPLVDDGNDDGLPPATKRPRQQQQQRRRRQEQQQPRRMDASNVTKLQVMEAAGVSASNCMILGTPSPVEHGDDDDDKHATSSIRATRGRLVSQSTETAEATTTTKATSASTSTTSTTTNLNGDHAAVVGSESCPFLLFTLGRVAPITASTTTEKDTDAKYDDEELYLATIQCRPSKRNRSPYVADVWLHKEQRSVLAHVPNLDMGGKCVNGRFVLVKSARDRHGHKVGSDAVHPVYRTPKCEFITQLLFVDDNLMLPDSSQLRCPYSPVWVGAHPSLGERIAEVWLRENRLLDQGMPPIVHVQKQVSFTVTLPDDDEDDDNDENDLTTTTTSSIMRSDFVVTHDDGSRRIVEVKTVVDTDYAADAVPRHDDDDKEDEEEQNDNDKPKKKSQAVRKQQQQRRRRRQCIFTSTERPYRRTAIFPWGIGQQKGPKGEKVISARAIHHVRALTQLRLQQQQQQQHDGVKTMQVPRSSRKKATGVSPSATTVADDGVAEIQHATILFVVVRGDAEAFRPNSAACPSFVQYLWQAQQLGVQLLARSVAFGCSPMNNTSTTTTTMMTTTRSGGSSQHDDAPTITMAAGRCYDGKALPIEWPKSM